MVNEICRTQNVSSNLEKTLLYWRGQFFDWEENWDWDLLLLQRVCIGRKWLEIGKIAETHNLNSYAKPS